VRANGRILPVTQHVNGNIEHSHRCSKPQTEFQAGVQYQFLAAQRVQGYIADWRFTNSNSTRFAAFEISCALTSKPVQLHLRFHSIVQLVTISDSRFFGCWSQSLHL